MAGDVGEHTRHRGHGRAGDGDRCVRRGCRPSLRYALTPRVVLSPALRKSPEDVAVVEGSEDEPSLLRWGIATKYYSADVDVVLAGDTPATGMWGRACVRLDRA